MTENEARLILDVRISRFDHAEDVNKALEIAKQALKEVQRYRKIGTVEECREAVEKRKPVRPHRNYEKFSGLWCECGWYLGHGIRLDINYCPNCGHAIQWDLGIRGNGR